MRISDVPARARRRATRLACRVWVVATGDAALVIRGWHRLQLCDCVRWRWWVELEVGRARDELDVKRLGFDTLKPAAALCALWGGGAGSRARPRPRAGRPGGGAAHNISLRSFTERAFALSLTRSPPPPARPFFRDAQGPHRAHATRRRPGADAGRVILYERPAHDILSSAHTTRPHAFYCISQARARYTTHTHGPRLKAYSD